MSPDTPSTPFVMHTEMEELAVRCATLTPPRCPKKGVEILLKALQETK